jgi:pimeloyl-ACP methyl ester carboxylesterase
MKPTIILVHGAWADGSNWRKVIAELKPQGFEIVAAQIPLTSFQDDVDTVVRLTARQQKPVVMVGHSYSGAVITAVASRTEGTKALVYITAYAPREDETIGAIRQKDPGHPLRPELAPDAEGFVWMTLSGVQNALVHGADDTEQQLFFASQKPIAAQILGEKMPAPSWKTVPSWYLVCEDDRMCDVQTQRFMAERAGSKIVSARCGHMPLLSQPNVVAEIIAEAARSES